MFFSGKLPTGFLGSVPCASKVDASLPPPPSPLTSHSVPLLICCKSLINPRTQWKGQLAEEKSALVIIMQQSNKS